MDTPSIRSELVTAKKRTRRESTTIRKMSSYRRSEVTPVHRTTKHISQSHNINQNLSTNAKSIKANLSNIFQTNNFETI